MKFLTWSLIASLIFARAFAFAVFPSWRTCRGSSGTTPPPGLLWRSFSRKSVRTPWPESAPCRRWRDTFSWCRHRCLVICKTEICVIFHYIVFNTCLIEASLHILHQNVCLVCCNMGWYVLFLVFDTNSMLFVSISEFPLFVFHKADLWVYFCHDIKRLLLSVQFLFIWLLTVMMSSVSSRAWSPLWWTAPTTACLRLNARSLVVGTGSKRNSKVSHMNLDVLSHVFSVIRTNLQCVCWTVDYLEKIWSHQDAVDIKGKMSRLTLSTWTGFESKFTFSALSFWDFLLHPWVTYNYKKKCIQLAFSYLFAA